MRGRCLAWGTLIFGFTWNYLGLWWLNTLTAFNPFIPAGVILLSLSLTVFLMIFAFTASHAMRRMPAWISPFAVGALWAGVEYLRSLTDLAFPWNPLGLSQHTGPVRAIIQWADVAGVYCVSFAVAAANAGVMLLARGVVRFARGRGAGHLYHGFKACLPVLICVALLAALGHGREKHWRMRSHPGPGRKMPRCHVGVIQPNVPQTDKWEAYSPETTDERRQLIELRMAVELFDLARYVAPLEPHIVVMPESAFISPFFIYDNALHAQLRRLALDVNADIFFGADNRMPLSEYLARLGGGLLTPDEDAPPTTRTLARLGLRTRDDGTTELFEPENMAQLVAAWLVKPEDGLTPYIYEKVQLVPFGEAAPYFDRIPFFRDYILMVGSFQRGVEQTIFESGGIRYGALICFESAFARLAGGLARGGARMICVITNDAWYDPKYLEKAGGFWGTLFRAPVLRTLAASGPSQHYVMSIFRAIETRRPVVRCANTGISAFITPAGEVTWSAPFGVQAATVEPVFIPTWQLTFYSHMGDWFGAACAAFLAAVAAIQFYNRMQRRKNI